MSATVRWPTGLPRPGRILGPVSTLLALLVGGLPGTLAAQDPLPPPPGAPAPEARAPVLIVPGWADEAEVLEPLRERFLDDGWPGDRVRILEFEDPVGSNREHADELAAAITRLQADTGAEAVDVVAHSMGGIALRYMLQEEGAAEVRRVVFLATPHRGTATALLAWGEGGEEIRPGSEFMTLLNLERPVPDGVLALTIRTPVDLMIVPAESATLPGATNIEVCCPTHSGLLDHEETYRRTRNFLLARGKE